MTGDAPPHLLVVGHITHDRVIRDGAVHEHMGGAGSFAALAGARMGHTTALVTAAPANHPYRATLERAELAGVHVARSRTITTFELRYQGAKRHVRLCERAAMLSVTDVPPPCRWASVVYLGPVAGEMAPEIVGDFAGFVVAGLQGWLRVVDDDGRVGPLQPDRVPDLVHRLPAKLGLASLSEDDHPRADALARALAARGITTAVTRGAAGATLFPAARGQTPAPLTIAPVVTREVDPTGAGDVFALVLGLTLRAGHTLAQAGAEAAAAASRVVQGPGLGGL